jgi:dipeptidyl-peptidase-4
MNKLFSIQINIILICFLIIINKLNAQNKQLSLDDAVLRQWSLLAPKNIQGIQWLPETDFFTLFTEEGKVLSKMDVRGNKTELLTLEDFNKTTETKNFPNLKWIDKEHFYFSKSDTFFSYNIKKKKADYILTHSGEAENLNFHYKSAHAAYTIENNLYIATATDSKIQITNFDKSSGIVSGQSIARSEFGISNGIFWSNNGSHLAFYQKDESNVNTYPLLDIRTTPGTLRNIRYPMAGQKSEYAKVGIYEVKTKKIFYLDIKGEEDQYLTNLAWDPTDKFVYVVLVNRAQNHIWFNQYNAKDGSFIKTLFEEEHPKYVEPEHPAWFIPNHPKEFLWRSEREGFMQIYHYNTNGELLGKVTPGKIVVEEILGLTPNDKEVIFTAFDESGLNQHLYAASLKKYGTERKITKTDGIHNISLNSEGSHFIDNFSNLNTPRIISIVETKSEKEIHRLLEAENPLKDYKIGKIELLSLKAEDGTPLHARFIKPSNFDPTKKYPVLVYVYGGPHAQMVNNSWLGAAQLWMSYMAEKGFLVFTLDNRGSANRGFEFENIIHRQLGSTEIKDQMTGVEYLKSLPYVDADKMAVHGWSFGGFMTISMMLRTPDVFKVGVAGGPVTDWKFYEIMYGERYMDTPSENAEGYATARLHQYSKNLKGDLMLIHGTVDDVVVEQHSLSLIKSFVENGILVDYFPYPMHEHNVRGKDRVHLMKKVLTYIENKLK